MASVFDVAKYILHQKGNMSTWKLQKLCYYSQAWHYTWTEQPLFNEHFEAWSNGPVCPALFHAHQGKFSLGENEIPYGSIDNLTEDERESIDIILRDYGAMEPYALREQTHAEAPWKNARGSLPEGAPGKGEITIEAMGAYYGSL